MWWDHIHTHRDTHTLRAINLGLIDSPQPSGPCRPNNNSLTTGLFLPRPDLLPNVSKHTHIHTFTMSFLLGDGMYSLYVTYYRCRMVSRGSKVRPPIVSRSVWSFKAAHCSVAEKKESLLFCFYIPWLASELLLLFWHAFISLAFQCQHVGMKWKFVSANLFSLIFFPLFLSAYFLMPPSSAAKYWCLSCLSVWICLSMHYFFCSSQCVLFFEKPNFQPLL